MPDDRPVSQIWCDANVAHEEHADLVLEHVMSARVTIHTIAAKAGVSTSTVSQVLRRTGRISEETRRLVMRVAKEENYVLDRRASAMRSGVSRDVGLLIQNIRNPLNAEVIVGLNDRLEQAGFLTFVLDTLDDLERQDRFLQTLISGKVGGLLWVPADKTSEETVDWVRKTGTKTITLLRPAPGFQFDHVGVDFAEGTAMATRHLIELGHRNIAFLGGFADNVTTRRRISGYLGALLDVPGAQPIIRDCPENKTIAAEKAFELMKAHPELTGIVCNCDVNAAGVTLGLQQMGLVPGRDVSVIGFDGIEDSALWTPALSTISVDPQGLGRQLAEVLIDRHETPETPVRSINMPMHLVPRASSGPVPTGGAHGESR